jgi:multisubunit Na+/H+ antiporter MnhG subunit
MLIDDKWNGRTVQVGDVIAPVDFIVMIGSVTGLVATPVSILTAFAAVPIFRYMRRHDYRSSLADAFAGLLMACVVIAVLSLVHFEAEALVSADYIYAVLIVLIAGPVSGMMVGHVERRARNGESHVKV